MKKRLLNLKNVYIYFYMCYKKHTKENAEILVDILRKHISKKIKIIGSIGRGMKTSYHDIDILIPNKKFDIVLKRKLTRLLTPSLIENTDWNGWYFHNTYFGDIDFFNTIDDFDF